MPEPIKVLIVEDSPTVSRILTTIIESDPAFQIVGLASDGAEAIRLTSRLRPNIITMDVNMPRMSGLEATEYIMAHQPTPILVLTAFGKQDVDLSFKMLSAGALEFIEKPEAEELRLQKKYLLDRLKLLSRIKVITHVRGRQRAFKEMLPSASSTSLDYRGTAPLDPSKIYKPPPGNRVSTARPASLVKPVVQAHSLPAVPAVAPDKKLLSRKFAAVGIAASTGGPPALAKLLREIPGHFPVPIFLVQHIPAGFSGGLADWLNGETALRVKLAEEGETPRPGFAYLPADDRHLTFLPDGRLHMDTSPARYGLRPSADLTFEAMSKVWTGKTLAVILTGMGRDGSIGMRHLNEAGGYNIAQDEASCVIYGMPKAAVDLGVVDHILPLNQIASFLKQVLKIEPPA